MDTYPSLIDQEDLFGKFEDNYDNFMSNIMKNNLLTNISDKIFIDFPYNLPREIKDNLTQYLDELPNKDRFQKRYSDSISKLRTRFKEKRFIELVKNLSTPQMNKKDSSLIAALLLIFAISNNDLLKADNIIDFLSEDFKDVIYSRQLIMIIAHLEAFIVDSMKIICYVCPEKMKRLNKSIELEKLLNAKREWKSILEVIIENYIQKLDCKISIKKSIEILENEFDIKIGNTNLVKIIDQSEQIRHIYIHNGGKADLKFIENTGFRDITIGERYQITKRDIMNCYEQCISLANELFDKITEKHFKNIKK